MTKPRSAQTEALFSTFERLETNARSYPYSFPAVFQRAKGSRVYDVDGRSWIDFFAGAGALNYGHNHEQIKARLIEHLTNDGLIHGLDAHTSTKERFLALFEEVILRPRNLDFKVLFCGPTGTEAVEAALKLARRITGRTGMVAFTGGYHGVSRGSLALTTYKFLRATAGVPLGDVTFIPYPEGPTGSFDAAAHLENLLQDDHSGLDLPAAVFMESLQVEGGIFAMPAAQMRALREVCDRHGILLVVDEIQTGCGRTGPFFAFERNGVVPDLVTMSKSIGGYGLPMSILLLRRAHDVWKSGEQPGTFRGHQLAFVAAAAALELWKGGDLTASVLEHERWLRAFFDQHLAGTKLEARGSGLAWGVDFSKAGGGIAAKEVTSHAFDDGLMIERCGRGRTVVKLTPPIVIDAETLKEGSEILLRAIRRVVT
jgi:diaminobutyrate-2-oxoglutarate transaminase